MALDVKESVFCAANGVGTDVEGSMDLMNGQAGSVTTAATASEKSSSSESLSDKGSELKKSFDAVVFDVLKVTPEEYAVSLPPLLPPAFVRNYILVLLS